MGTINDAARAQKAIIELTPKAQADINDFSRQTFLTRGGRMGSGMGTLLEALWGYFVNRELIKRKEHFEIAWLSEHEYNDFALVDTDGEWQPSTRKGELLRIEAKSMNIEADESKGHFDELSSKIGPLDLLLVLIWRWKSAGQSRVYPFIIDSFNGPAKPIADLRDGLHIARGGSFVAAGDCPDGCNPSTCKHIGEPLNASGKRERLSGPENARPSNKVAYAANFGGLVRMLKTNSSQARQRFRELRDKQETAHGYVTTIHRNYPSEEENQYVVEDWRKLAALVDLEYEGLSKSDLVKKVREKSPDYRNTLRHLDREVELRQAE